MPSGLSGRSGFSPTHSRVGIYPDLERLGRVRTAHRLSDNDATACAMRTLRDGSLVPVPARSGGIASGFARSQGLGAGAIVRIATARDPTAVVAIGTAASHDRISAATRRAMTAQDLRWTITHGIAAARDPITTASVGSAGATVRIVVATVGGGDSPVGSAVNSIGSAGNPVGIGSALREVAPLPTVLPAPRN